MEAVQVGFRAGLEAAQARVDGTFKAPLTWNKVRPQLLDFQPDAILDGLPYAPEQDGGVEDELFL